jgi:hypothetical protein
MHTTNFKIRMISWAGHVACKGYNKNAYRVLAGKPIGKRPLGTATYRWEGDTKIDLKETGWNGMGWSLLAEDRNQWQAVLFMVMNVPVSYIDEKFFSNSNWWLFK